MRPFHHLHLAILIVVLLVGGHVVRAQSGMEWSDFKRKLEPYFADELLEDVKNALPQGAQYRIWGWDVGDFSGDSFYDVAFSVQTLGGRKQEMTVYLFVDNEGFLTNIARLPLVYVDLPLEIGVVVKNNACYVTQKRKAESWAIKGYQYRDGSLVLLDEFVSDKLEQFGHEGYRNYLSLETRERYFSPKGEEEFDANYLTIPCYGRGRQIFAGYVADVDVSTTPHVDQGAFYWSGADDGSFTAKAVYDDEYLYFRINVRDSNVITGWCDTCTADRFDIWLDVTPPVDEDSRFITGMSRRKPEFRTTSDSGLFAFSIKIGDFEDIRPSVKVKTTDDLDAEQEAAIQKLRVVTSLRSDGYVIKIRIPFLVLGYDRAPIDEKQLTELGCTLAMYDVDNEFRPDETTRLATSPIDVLNPATYGAIRFVPDGLWYGQTDNIYTDAVMNYLQELGF